MATLERYPDGKRVEVPDGSSLMDAAEELNVTFRCRGGGCGACKTKILVGQENLSPQSKNEKRYDDVHGMEPDERLMCQTKILASNVLIEPQEPEHDALGRLRCPGLPEGEPGWEPA